MYEAIIEILKAKEETAHRFCELGMAYLAHREALSVREMVEFAANARKIDSRELMCLQTLVADILRRYPVA